MEIIIANNKFERIGIIENASVIWTTRYYESGDFELYMSATQEHLDLINQGSYVIRDDDEDSIGVIEDMVITNTPEDGDKLTVTGRFASGYYLSSRVITQQTQMKGNFQDSIRNLVLTNIIEPNDSKRKIDFIKLGNLDTTITETLEMQTTGDNLLTKIEETSQTVGIGFKMPLRKGKLYFETYKGINRSYSQNENPWIILSDEYDSLKSCEYIVNTSGIINFAYVAGEGEGLDRKIVGTTNLMEEPAGEFRREIWVDQRNISSNNEDITEAELINQMKEEGNENLVGISEAFSGEISAQGYTYKKDYFIGDIVTIQKSKWNDIYINARIIEVIESEDQEGKKITLTCGI